jgi:tetraacyldisaccharide 4'-kinase
VGNLYVGGTGKTPLTIHLVQALQARGFSPGVVSRGYGASADAVRPVGAADGQTGDEAALIAARTGAPVFAGRQRAAAAAALMRAYPATDVILADDGLQHYALARDVEIALVDERGHGNGWLLPAGPLREGPWRLNTVDAIVARGAAVAAARPVFSMRLEGSQAVNLRSGEVRALEDFRGRAVLAAAGIAQPERFFSHLEHHGIRARTLPLPDHYAFASDPFAGATEEAILITEKDAVKCRPLDDARLWAVPVQAAVDPGLVDLVVEKLRGPSAT